MCNIWVRYKLVGKYRAKNKVISLPRFFVYRNATKVIKVFLENDITIHILYTPHRREDLHIKDDLSGLSGK